MTGPHSRTGMQDLLPTQELLGKRRRRHDSLTPGPLDRLLQMRVIALRNGSPLVTVNPTSTQRHPDIFVLHPPLRKVQGWGMLDATPPMPHEQTSNHGTTQVHGRPPIR